MAVDDVDHAYTTKHCSAFVPAKKQWRDRAYLAISIWLYPIRTGSAHSSVTFVPDLSVCESYRMLDIVTMMVLFRLNYVCPWSCTRPTTIIDVIVCVAAKCDDDRDRNCCHQSPIEHVACDNVAQLPDPCMNGFGCFYYLHMLIYVLYSFG